MLNKGILILWGLLAVAYGGQVPECPNFKELVQSSKQSGVFMCLKKCMAYYWGSGSVYGNKWYSEGSDVCRTGRHSGIIGEDGGLLGYSKIYFSDRKYIYGTSQNGVSSSRTGWMNEGYAVWNPKGNSNERQCPTFQDLKLDTEARISAEIYCSSDCLSWDSNNGNVFGATLYDERSDACLAGLHSGALDPNGGYLSFMKTSLHPSLSFYGTCRNRICSKNTGYLSEAINISKSEESSQASVVGDVMFVHNSFLDGRLQALCLYDPSIGKDSPAMRMTNWNYKDFSNVERVGDSKVILQLNKDDSKSRNVDLHGICCLGKQQFSDVCGPLVIQDASYKSEQYTWRVNAGESLVLQMHKKSERLINKELTKHPITAGIPFKADITALRIDRRTYNLTIGSVFKGYDGLYQIGGPVRGAYFNIIVRDCSPGKYGSQCSSPCWDCKNGGECHSHTGECICRPGFMGETCDIACPKGWFGTQCQYQCNSKVLLLSLLEENSCRGITICLPRPMGCSCLAGYKGPLCREDCSAGTYGAGCTNSCEKCQSNQCDPYTGSCLLHNSLETKAPMNFYYDRIHGRESQIKLTWQRGYESSYPRNYFINSKVTKSCFEEDVNKEQLMYVKTEEYELQNLRSDSEYSICVTAVDKTTGLSEPVCITYSTLKQEGPEVQFSCEVKNQKISCEVTGECLNVYLPNSTFVFELSSFDLCGGRNITDKGNVALQDATRNPNSQETSVSYLFKDTPTSRQYNLSVTSLPKMINLTEQLYHGRLPPVQSLTVAILGPYKARLMWKDPCSVYPSQINGYTVNTHCMYYTRKYDVSKSDSSCPSMINFDGCYTLQDLKKGKYYESSKWSACSIEINYTGRKKSDPVPFNFTMKEMKPSTPILKLLTMITEEDFKVTILPPVQPGGELVNCSLAGLGDPCTIDYTEEVEMSCQLRGLKPGKMYNLEASCCNTVFCSEVSTVQKATKPKPTLTHSAKVKEVTNSTISIILPEIGNEGDGNTSIYIVVEKATEGEVRDLRSSDIKTRIEEMIRLQENEGQAHRMKRRDVHVCGKNMWIAGKVSEQKSKEFVVGDESEEYGFHNCPLTLGEKYGIGFLAKTSVLDQQASIWKQMDALVEVIPASSDHSINIVIAVVSALVVIFVIIGVIAFFIRNPRKRDQVKGLFSGGVSEFRQNDTPSPEREIPNPPVRVIRNPPAIRMSQIPSVSQIPRISQIPREERVEVTQTEEPIYANKSQRIPLKEVEKFLNLAINSHEVVEEFLTIPANFKVMNIGKDPAYKKKNRYGNNLPYDETRVHLSEIEGDPLSHYINANHIQGFGRTRYIASQGPKGEKYSTIEDFWRMIVEQQVTDIIMPANFIENGKNKVGQYFKSDETLEFGNFTIRVISSENFPYFTISKIEVFSYGNFRQNVFHYHYSNWPDHGVPCEARTMARLVTTFRERQRDGSCVLVHCSAGIGRTGTVLMVLLSLEMLESEGSVDPLEVVIRLREGRGRLVENAPQYKLGLEITDEVLFGNITAVSSALLQDRLAALLRQAPTEFEKAKSLRLAPSSSFNSDFSFMHLNRNPSILPPDRYRIFLSMIDGREESQYINAISIPGLSKEAAFLATEHPVHQAAGKFWRLIMEKKCSLVIFINTFSADMKEDFIPLFPKDKGSIIIDGYKITNNRSTRYSSSLLQYSLSVTDQNSLCNTLKGYEVQNWEYGSSVPETEGPLLDLADILLSSLQGGVPPLLCCGDGVTGCGLVAAATLLLGLAQTEQVFDVYRTVVKLQRCRYQFITCEDQYAMLYKTASKYADNFSIYSNFD